MALIWASDRFSLGGLRLFSSCMNFSQREMKSRSDSSDFGFGTGIKTPPFFRWRVERTGTISICGRCHTATSCIRHYGYELLLISQEEYLIRAIREGQETSDECVGRPCMVCNKIIQRGNYYCPRCKACICLYCGADILKEVKVAYLRCPRCGTKLNWKCDGRNSGFHCTIGKPDWTGKWSRVFYLLSHVRKRARFTILGLCFPFWWRCAADFAVNQVLAGQAL